MEYINPKSVQRKQYEYHRHCKDADTIVIFIHGILEGSMQFRSLAKIAYDEGYSTLVLLLPGHGKKGTDFANASMRKWIIYVNKKIKGMEKKYNNIILVGHSMGGLLAVEYVSHFKTNVTKLILIGFPIKIRINPKVLIGAFKISIGRINRRERYVVAECRAMGVEATKFIECTGWIPRYIELIHLIYHCRKQLKKIYIPMVIIQSYNDEFICRKIDKYIKLPNMSVYNLKNSSHFCYEHDDLNELENIIKKNFYDSKEKS